MTKETRITVLPGLRSSTGTGNGFLTFDMYKFGKIRRHNWKERLEISKRTKFESDESQACEGKAPQSYEKLQKYVWWGDGGGGGGKFVPPHCGPQTSVKFRDFEEVYLR